MILALFYTIFAFSNPVVSEINSLSAVKKWKKILTQEERCFSVDASRQERFVACIAYIENDEVATQVIKVEEVCQQILLEDKYWAFERRDWLHRQGLGRITKCANKLEEDYADYLYRLNNL